MGETGEEIKEGVITRYCKLTTLDEDTNLPTFSAFRQRQSENYLSVYLLDFFDQLAKEFDKVKAIKEEMELKGFRCRPSSLFANLDIQHSQKYILDEISEFISYKTVRLPHCGIFHDADDLLIAKLLAECVQSVYPTKDFTS